MQKAGPVGVSLTSVRVPVSPRTATPQPFSVPPPSLCPTKQSRRAVLGGSLGRQLSPALLTIAQHPRTPPGVCTGRIYPTHKPAALTRSRLRSSSLSCRCDRDRDPSCWFQSSEPRFRKFASSSGVRGHWGSARAAETPVLPPTETHSACAPPLPCQAPLGQSQECDCDRNDRNASVSLKAQHRELPGGGRRAGTTSAGISSQTWVGAVETTRTSGRPLSRSLGSVTHLPDPCAAVPSWDIH